MFTIISKQHQIFYPIVISNTIDMMHDFFSFQISPQVFFHNKTMFKNIIISIKWMVRFINQNISSGMFYFSIFPTWVIFTRVHNTHFYFFFITLFSPTFSDMTNAQFFPIFFRKFFSFIPRNFSKMRFSQFLDNFWSQFFFIFIPRFSHILSKIKRPLFSGLLGTVKFPRLLRDRILDKIIPFQTSNNIINNFLTL